MCYIFIQNFTYGIFLCFRVPNLVGNLDVKEANYDSVIVVTDKVEKLVGNLDCLKAPIESYAKV